MKLLYTAAPYRASTIVGIQSNIAEATIMAKHYWSQGYAVLCPHMNSAFFDGLVPDETFLSATMEMLRRCDVIALHSKWAKSAGCLAEYYEAARLEKEIIYYVGKEDRL